jgi:hypothetical protein
MSCIPKNIIEDLRAKLEKGQIGTDEIAKMLPEEKVALKAILENVVSDNLGMKVSSEEIANINRISKKIDEAQIKLGGDLGVPSKLKEHLDFFKAKREMESYLQSRTPSHNLKVLTSTIGRSSMLFSVKSPLMNIASNIEIGLSEALSRRITNFQLKGADNKLAVDFVKMTNKIYKETGYDISRMTTLNDLGSGGERVMGEMTHSQGPGAIRWVGRHISEDIVFKQLMGAPDVAFSSAHFADSVNLNAVKLAKSSGKPAKEIMLDSMRLVPQTPEGEILRAQGILDAQVATWTNETWASKLSTGTRKLLNGLSGDLRVGDYLLPFIKTKANVVATGMDYAGMGIPKAFFDLYKGIRTGEMGNRTTWTKITRNLVRAGLGIAGALLVTSKLKDEDYVGAYDPARAQIETLRNSTENSVRIRGKWISMEFFGPLAVPINAIMYARKYGKTGPEKMFQYSRGVLMTFFDIPGVSDVYDSVMSYAYKKNQSLEEMTGATTNYISSQIYSRLVPSILSDTSKAVDPTQRVTVKGFESIKSKIPFLSKTLPAKTNIFGEEMKNEPWWSVLTLGSRVKTDKEDALIKEISTVSNNNDKGISFTDWDKSSSKTLAQFKEKVGTERYDQAKIKYGMELKKQLEIAFKSSAYKKLSDEEKLKIINGQDAQAMTKIFNLYRFKYKPETNKKLPKL